MKQTCRRARAIGERGGDGFAARRPLAAQFAEEGLWISDADVPDAVEHGQYRAVSVQRWR
jgi:hypothetical protein